MNFNLKKCKVCFRHFTKIYIHHINGNRKDNRKENLIEICGNCISVSFLPLHKYT